jgi:atypical dual specificity phosphatase
MPVYYTAMPDMNFSWVLGKSLAGTRVPIVQDEVEYLKKKGVNALIRLTEKAFSGVHSSVLEDHEIIDYIEPIPDYSAPTQAQITRILAFTAKCIVEDKKVALACGAGRGRTGTLLACALVMNGYTAKMAVAEVRRIRPPSIESGDQENAIVTFQSLIDDDDQMIRVLRQNWPTGLFLNSAGNL